MVSMEYPSRLGDIWGSSRKRCWMCIPHMRSRTRTSRWQRMVPRIRMTRSQAHLLFRMFPWSTRWWLAVCTLWSNSRTCYLCCIPGKVFLAWICSHKFLVLGSSIGARKLVNLGHCVGYHMLTASISSRQCQDGFRGMHQLCTGIGSHHILSYQRCRHLCW